MNEDKFIVDRLKKECSMAIKDAKEKYFTDLGAKLDDASTGQKVYWKILNKFLNKYIISRIPPLSVQDKFITNCKEKASVFNIFYSSHVYSTFE